MYSIMSLWKGYCTLLLYYNINFYYCTLNHNDQNEIQSYYRLSVRTSVSNVKTFSPSQIYGVFDSAGGKRLHSWNTGLITYKPLEVQIKPKALSTALVWIDINMRHNNHSCWSRITIQCIRLVPALFLMTVRSVLTCFMSLDSAFVPL